MKKKRTKKYPVFTYLCYLLAVAALVTSVTFSRYSVATSGSVSTQVALYNCNYTIDNFSSFSFYNTDYMVDLGGTDTVVGTARTVRFTMNNHDDNGTTQVDAQGTIRFYLPAAFANNLAIQLVESTPAGATQNVITPQIVLGELIYNGTNSYYSYNNADLPDFKDYGELENSPTGWTVDGQLSNDGPSQLTITGEYTAGDTTGDTTITITAKKNNVAYSVGFQRSGMATPLYLDLKHSEVYYTIDITSSSMFLNGRNENSCTHVAYITLTEALTNDIKWSGTDNTVSGEPAKVFKNGTEITDLNKLITDPSTGYTASSPDSGIEITGYHFEQNVAGQDIRVKCEYADNGGYNVSLYHVAPVEENNPTGAYYVHPITFSGNSSNIQYDEYATPFTDTNATCSNGASIDVSSVTIDPLNGYYDENGDGINEKIEISVLNGLSRSFTIKMNAVFVQASQTP